MKAASPLPRSSGESGPWGFSEAASWESAGNQGERCEREKKGGTVVPVNIYFSWSPLQIFQNPSIKLQVMNRAGRWRGSSRVLRIG